MLYIEANHLTDGLYNIKDGKIYKYKAKGGTVRTYEIGELVRCGECKYEPICSHSVQHITHEQTTVTIDYKSVNSCSYGERRDDD